MPIDELSIRFSSEIYATKIEVSQALKTNMVDNIWNNIVSYRSQFTRVLSLKSIDLTSFNIVLTPTISDRLNSLERKLTKALITLARLPLESSLRTQVEQNLLVQDLLWIAKKYNLVVTNSLIENITIGNLSTISPDKMVLVRYLKSLKVVQNNYLTRLDEDLLARAYSEISGNAELVSLYRTQEIASLDQKTLINKSYNASPVNRLQDLMDNLLEFLYKSEISPLLKSMIAFYYINYIKPFDVYSEEMAVILMKSVLAHNDYDELGALLNFEQLLIENQENLHKIFTEVQKTNDLTYLVTYLIPLLDQAVTSFIDTLNTIKKDSLKNETPPLEGNNETLNEPNNGLIEAKAAVPETIKLISPVARIETRTIEEANIAISTLPVILDELDATKIENHLMESNPALKRSEAFFYARHCTIGKFYTIIMFKTKLNCAYETARTSMEHLVTLGYYRKEQLKNKFIYTPVAHRQ